MKEELRNLVEKIKERTGKTQEDIAIEMGYKKNYISEILSPKGTVSGKFLTSIKLRFSEALDVKSHVSHKRKESLPTVNEDPAIYNTILPLGDLKVTLKDYLDLVKQMAEKAEKEKERAEREKERLYNLLEKNTQVIKSNSETILAELQHVSRMIRADDLTMMDSNDRIEGREVGTSSTEASIVEHAFGTLDEEDHTTDSKDMKGNRGKAKKRQS